MEIGSFRDSITLVGQRAYDRAMKGARKATGVAPSPAHLKEPVKRRLLR